MVPDKAIAIPHGVRRTTDSIVCYANSDACPYSGFVRKGYSRTVWRVAVERDAHMGVRSVFASRNTAYTSLYLQTWTNIMRILIAMSGGVDSSVAAALLLREGHSLEGFTFVTDASPDSASAVRDAARCADQLGIPHRVLDISNEFNAAVKEYFVSSYESGLTPNPCVACNREIKFGLISRYAETEGFDAVATGHYARLRRENGRTFLYCGADPKKDQAYMLAAVPEQSLARAVFPLGELTKDEIRRIADDLGIITAYKKDSQDICFIPDGDYASFIENYRGRAHVPGNYVSPNGVVLGSHRGHMCYTIGQRRGLGIALGKHMFVLERCAESNTVVLGDENELFRAEVFAYGLNLIGADTLEDGARLKARIRYAHRGAAATVFTEGDLLRVAFDEPQRAPTPGQLLVLTREDEFGTRVLGGAEIIANDRKTMPLAEGSLE